MKEKNEKEIEEKKENKIEEKDENQNKPKTVLNTPNSIKFYEFIDKEISSNIISITLLLDFLILFIKILVGQYGYSGEKDPPNYGDFEAQRHWMEITLYFKPKEWYTNSELKKYWPLDYPPLSGYHSYIFGKILRYFMPESVEYKYSRGYETKIFKNVMRFFVLISDFFIFHLAIHFFCYKIFISDKIKKNKKPQYLNYIIIHILILLNPLMIIVDHGHYQFNNVMLGFFVFAVYFLLSDKYFFSIIFLSLCVNYKQMGLYYALLFPFYVIKKLFFSDKNKIISFSLTSVLYTIFYALTTIMINGIIYLPWIRRKNLKDVFNRIFPINRGIFEDKVATFWCMVNIFIKLKEKFGNQNLFKLSMIFTILGTLIPLYAIFKSSKINKKICIQCFFIISLDFYLFSFHVHEKTIIIPFLAYLINLPYMKNILPSFTLIGMFSLFPLLKRENQIVSYYLINFIFYFFAKQGDLILSRNTKKNENKLIYLFIELFIGIIMMGYHAAELLIPPPQKYPWFYPMINAMFCFCFFFGLFLYMNYSLIKQIKLKTN